MLEPCRPHADSVLTLCRPYVYWQVGSSAAVPFKSLPLLRGLQASHRAAILAEGAWPATRTVSQLLFNNKVYFYIQTSAPGPPPVDILRHVFRVTFSGYTL